MSAAVGFPRWVLLEPFVFRRDDDDSFPYDDTDARIVRASGTTSWGADFHMAFSLVEPPRISRLYARIPVPQIPGRILGNPLSIVGTHRHLALVRVATMTPEELTVQNFFIFNAADKINFSSSSLKALPPCTQPKFDYSRDTGDRVSLRSSRRLPSGAIAPTRLLSVGSLGFWCSGNNQNEFVVAELTIFKPRYRPKAYADICLLSSSYWTPSDGNGDQLRGTWDSMRVPILSPTTGDPVADEEDLWQFCGWETDAVIPFQRWLCWIDSHRGILFCDMSKLPAPTVSFIWFPLDKMPMTSYRTAACTFFGHGVSVVDNGRTLKFVNITRQDGVQFGPLKPGTGFTITCHTLVLGRGDRGMAWKEDYAVTSGELWDANPPERLPRGILMLPQVLDVVGRPHVVQFLFKEFRLVKENIWLVTIDMSTKTVESFSLYFNGDEAFKYGCDFIQLRSTFPRPFLPCEFPKFFNLSRKRRRKDMD